jgi:hypothetical protein
MNGWTTVWISRHRRSTSLKTDWSRCSAQQLFLPVRPGPAAIDVRQHQEMTLFKSCPFVPHLSNAVTDGTPA